MSHFFFKALIGNVGQTPVITTLDSGKKVARISIARNETYTNEKGEKIQNTDWHTLVGWGKVADIFEEYVDKGSEIGITGKLTSRSYDDKQGEKKYVTEVIVDEILLLGKKGEK